MKLRGKLTLCYAREQSIGEPARFGFIVSKAVGNAVMRNLVRRRMKDIVRRQLQAGFAGYDVVIRALPATASAPFADLKIDIDAQLKRLSKQAGHHVQHS